MHVERQELMAAYPMIKETDLEAICGIMADTNNGLTGSEIHTILARCNIPDINPNLTKRYRLFEALNSKQKEDKCSNNLLNFIQQAMAPQRYIGKDEFYEEFRSKLNAALSFAGYNLNEKGQLVPLQASVSSLRELDSNKFGSLSIGAIFKKRNFEPDKFLVFAAIPLNDQFKRIYDERVTPALKNNHFTVMRSDLDFRSGTIMEQIWELINKAKFVIADVTNKNSNVFYELGLAHAIGKECLITTQNENDVPFDIQHLRYIHYSDNKLGWRKLTDELLKFINSTI